MALLAGRRGAGAPAGRRRAGRRRERGAGRCGRPGAGRAGDRRCARSRPSPPRRWTAMPFARGDVAAVPATADGHRRSAGRRAVSPAGRRRRGRAHLHRRAGAGRRRHDPHPGECAALDAGAHRGRRRRSPPAATSAAPGSISRKATCCSSRAACSMPRRCRWRPPAITPSCRLSGGRWSPSSPPATSCCRRAARRARTRSLRPTPMASPRSLRAAARRVARPRHRAATARHAIAAPCSVRGRRGADVIVTLGGASVGDHDLVHAVLTGERHDARFLEDRDAPGQAADVRAPRPTRVVGLPGNPVASLVCSHLFLKPLIAGSPDATTRRRSRDASAGRGDGRQRSAPGLCARQGHPRRRPMGRDAVPGPGFLDAEYACNANALIVREPFAPAAPAGAACRLLMLR